MRRLTCGLSLLIVLCAITPALAQQGTAQLTGKITDAQGGVLPGVNLIITNEDTGVVRETVSTAEGTYVAPQMVPGRYRITAKMEGFKALDRREVVLIIGQTTTIDLQMEVGGLAETLTVTGEAPLVDVTSSEIGGHISANELNDIPSINRNYMALIGNVPGTVFVPSAEFLNDTFQANGQVADANNVVFDGAGNTDEQRGSNVGGQTRAANESIAEVQVITNQFDAEWGRASGAVINAVTKSGTNNITGSAFNFYTSKAMTNKDYFARVNDEPKPEVGKKEWGGTIGGPIVRNKLHYFFSLERIKIARNFSNTFTNRPDLNVTTASEESAWNTLIRVDHQLTNKHTWAYRWLREVAPQFGRLDGTNETLSSYGDETDLDQTHVFNVTSVLSDTKVNTFRVGAVIEDTVHANPAWRALKSEYARCVPCPDNAGLDQAMAPPRLDYDQFDIQAATTMDYSIQRGYSLANTMSWFIPEAKGRHDIKFGAQWTRTWLTNPNWSNMNGSYVFRGNADRAFNAADPRTYPERLNIRVPGPRTSEMTMHVGEFFIQDKWQAKPGLTFSLGVRYDLEVYPYEIDPGNPLFPDKSKYPVDTNNIAPRIGFIWNPDGANKSVVRGGYGMFYDRTLLGQLESLQFNTKYARSFEVNFPQASRDLGPSQGTFPTDPTLRSGRVDILTPEVRAYINSVYPPGTVQRNTGTVTWDSPNRKQPVFHQFSFGYEREVLTGLSVAADYIRMSGRDMFLNPNLNIALGVDTTRDGPRVTPVPDPFGILAQSTVPGEAPWAAGTTVRLLSTDHGYNEYDALNLSVEKRYGNNYSIRGAYTRSYSRGVSAAQGDTPQLQTGTDLHLDDYEARAGSSRKHNLVMSGRMEIPKTHGVTLSGMLRMLSGTFFTLQDDTFDLDRNRINFDPVDAGTYNPFPEAGEHVYRDVETNGRRNGAEGPGFIQLDMRLGYRARLGARRSLDIFYEMFNVTDRANFTNPGGNMRERGNFLRFNGLVGSTGFPRQSQIGVRLGF